MVIASGTKKGNPFTQGCNHWYNESNKKKEGHELLIALDGNERFIQNKGGISRLCHEYKLHDPFTHLHGKECETNSQIRGSYRIYYYLCTYNPLKRIKLCGITDFNDITSSYHCGFYLDVQSEALNNPQAISTPSPFERKLNSKSPQAVRTYKKD